MGNYFLCFLVSLLKSNISAGVSKLNRELTEKLKLRFFNLFRVRWSMGVGWLKIRFFGQLAEISKRQYLSEKTINLFCQGNNFHALLCFPRIKMKKVVFCQPSIKWTIFLSCKGRERGTLIIKRFSHIKKGAGLFCHYFCWFSQIIVVVAVAAGNDIKSICSD